MSTGKQPKPGEPVARSRGQRKHRLIYTAPIFQGVDLCFVASDKGARQVERLYALGAGSLSRPSSLRAVGRTDIVTVGDVMLLVVLMDMAQVLTCKDYTWIQLAGLCAHEATHVVDAIFEHVGEEAPGHETRAYYTQWVAETAMQFYWDRYREAIVDTIRVD